MYWSNFFHIYQPFDQRKEILERIVNESYRPLISGWLKNPNARITLNINACLTEMLFRNGFKDVINSLSKLALRGQLEFTSSGKFHPFLPVLPKSEIIRQIILNDQTNRKYFGKAYHPVGFFPPEMGYSQKVGEAVGELGYKWIVLDEIAFNGKIDQVKYDRLYKLKTQKSKVKSTSKKSKISTVIPGQAGIYTNNYMDPLIREDDNLYIFFRERRMSNLIMAAMLRTPESLWEAVGAENGKNRYLLTAMDGETFGHHRPGLDKMLLDLYHSSQYKLVTVSGLLDLFEKKEMVEPVSGSWASSEKEILQKQNFYLYYNPKNKLHSLQKKLIDLAIKTVSKQAGPVGRRLLLSFRPTPSAVEGEWRNLIHQSLLKKIPRLSSRQLAGRSLGMTEIGPLSPARKLLDSALSCNHMWWANPDAWWSIEEIEKGAYNLLKAIKACRLHSPIGHRNIHKRAEKLYQEIMAQAFMWQRQGLPQKLHDQKENFKKIPFKKRAKPGEYEALLAILKEEEEKAVKRKEYELAIRWRDSGYKLEKGLDIYDFMHIVDQMRFEGRLGKYEELAKKFRTEYKKYVPGQADK